jgi:hypothetical protein
MKEKRISFCSGVALISFLGLISLLCIFFIKGGKEATSGILWASLFLGILGVASGTYTLKKYNRIPKPTDSSG